MLGLLTEPSPEVWATHVGVHEARILLILALHAYYNLIYMMSWVKAW